MPEKSKRIDGEEGLVLDQFLPYRLSVLQQEVSRTIARIYSRQYDLMRYDWRVLAVLGNYQPLSANDVCERTNMDKVQVSRAIARLKIKKLVTQQQDSTDKRKSVLRLSREGERIYREIAPRARAREAELLAALDEADREQFGRLIGLLYDRAREMNRG